MKNIKRILVVFVIALLCTSNSLVANAKVKTINKKLSMNTVYSSYDITGDNKKDSIKVSYNNYSKEEKSYKGLLIYVNNKKVYTLKDKWARDFSKKTNTDIRFIRLANNKKYILVKYDGNMDYNNKGFLLQYKSGKLTKVKDILGLPGLSSNLSAHYLYVSAPEVQSIKVKDNSIIVRNKTDFITTGNAVIDVYFTYKKGNILRSNSSKVIKVVNSDGKSVTSLKAKKTLQVYKDTKLTKKYFKIKSKQTVSISRIGGVYKKYYVKVKVGKKTGYIKAMDLNDINGNQGSAEGLGSYQYFYKVAY